MKLFKLFIVLSFTLLLSANNVVASRIDALRRRETKKSRVILALIMIALGVVVFIW